MEPAAEGRPPYTGCWTVRRQALGQAKPHAGPGTVVGVFVRPLTGDDLRRLVGNPLAD